MKKTLFCLISTFLLSFNLLVCQQNIVGLPINRSIDDKGGKYSAGIYAHYNYNMHVAQFVKLPGIPNCCPRFESGYGGGFELGGLFEKGLGDNVNLGIRLSFASIGATLNKKESLEQGVILNGALINGEFEHILIADITNFGLDLYSSVQIIDNLTLRFGLRYAKVITKEYEQWEKISKPEKTGTFGEMIDDSIYNSGDRIRNESKGQIPNATLQHFALTLGLGYDLPMNKKGDWLISPEIYYNYGFTEIVESYDWYIRYLSAGLAVKYKFLPEEKDKAIFKEIERIDTIRLRSDMIANDTYIQGIYQLDYDTSYTENFKTITTYLNRTDTIYIKNKIDLMKANIRVVGVDYSENEIENPTFVIEEFQSTQLHPLLNYIFFEKNDFQIPKRYNLLSAADVKAFNISKLLSYNVMPVYSNIFNIIGSRMQQYPSASLVIKGFNSGTGEEKNNLELSRQRVEQIKNYFINIWGINESRLKTEAKNLPDKASTPIDDPEKEEENRRVEIYSENPKILEPVLIADTLREVNIPILRYYLEYTAPNDVNNLEILNYQSNKLIKVFNFEKSSELISNSNENNVRKFDWFLNDDQELTPKNPIPLDYNLKVNYESGKQILTDKKSVNIKIVSIERKAEESIKDKKIDRYSLILFDFDKSDIENRNKDISNFIRSNLKPNSKVYITGYTDKTGDDEYNRVLSLKRAEATANALNITKAEIKGLGESKLLYDNTIPEGRFYCRTVRIIVETPVEK